MQTPLSIKETLYLLIINKKIKQEIEECIFRLNLKALLPFISIIQETAREAIIKEEVFDHCNKKLIDLQENYKDNITNEQQKQIDELQNTINYFYHNPKEVIQQIVDYSFQLDKLKESSIKKKGEIYLIIKKIGQQKKSLATSKNILLEEYYIEYINQKNNKIFLLTEQLSINENETKINNNKLLIQLYKLAELKNNLSQVKEYLTKLNQQSSELELEKNRAKEENNQENIKLIEEKISENISEFNSNQELIINLSNNINAINNEIKDINNILSQLKDTQETVEKNITNEKTKIDNTKQKLELEQKEKIRTNISKTFFLNSSIYEDYINFIDNNLYQNKEILKINTTKIEQIKNMNLTDIYKHKTVKEPFAQILSNNSAITKNSGQRDSDDFKMIIPFALYEPSGQGWRSTEFDDLQMNIDFVPSDQHWSQIKVDDFKINMPFFSASPSAREESENNANFNMDTLSSPNASFEEMIKIGESLEIQQEQEKQEFIQKELYKYMCYFKLETLAPFVSLTEESKINQKLKEEIFDHCNNKLINLQENYQDYITEEQQQQINNIQNIINYFNQNPQIIINSIKNHITKFYGLEQSKEQIKIEIAMIEDELHQEQKLQQQAEVIAVTERALNKEVKIPDKIISLKEYYVCLKNEIMQAQYIFKNILYENQKAIESEKIKNCQNLLLQLESRQKEIIENIENIKEELNTTEQKLQSQIEKDNQLNHSEMVLIKRKDYINLIERNLYQNAQLLDIIESQIKKSQEINLQGIVKDLVAQETVSNNLATTANNLVISTPSASAYSTKNPNIPNKTNVLPIGTKRKIEKKNPDYPNVI